MVTADEQVRLLRTKMTEGKMIPTRPVDSLVTLPSSYILLRIRLLFNEHVLELTTGVR